MRKISKIVVCLMAAALGWQGCSPQQSAAQNGTNTDTNASRLDLFAGYSYWAPHATVNGLSYKSIDAGMLFSGAYYFNRYVGAQIEGERHQQTENDGMRAFSAGAIVRYPTRQEYTPFVHALAGGGGLTGPNVPSISGSGFYFNPEQWGGILTVGGGMDYATPLLHHHLSLRLIQADYQHLHVNFGPALSTTGGQANINAARVSAGVVYSVR